jgi:hypothetical protein
MLSPETFGGLYFLITLTMIYDYKTGFPIPCDNPALKHVLTLLYVSYGFEDRKIFFFAKKGRQPNSNLIGIAWINL